MQQVPIVVETKVQESTPTGARVGRRVLVLNVMSACGSWSRLRSKSIAEAWGNDPGSIRGDDSYKPV